MTKLLSILTVSILAAGCAKKEGGGDKVADKATATDKATQAPAAKPTDVPANPPTDPPPAQPTDKPAAAQAYSDDRSVALAGKIAGVYEAAGTDCAKLAAGIEKFAAENKDEVSAQNAWKATLSPEQVGALDTRYANELGLAKKMMAGAQACADDARVASALKTLSFN